MGLLRRLWRRLFRRRRHQTPTAEELGALDEERRRIPPPTPEELRALDEERRQIRRSAAEAALRRPDITGMVDKMLLLDPSDPSEYVLLQEMLRVLVASKDLSPAVLPQMERFSQNWENPAELKAMAKQVVDRLRISNQVWVATVLLESNGEPTNSTRLECLRDITRAILGVTEGDLVVLFPGMWFNAGHDPASTLYPWIEESVRGILPEEPRRVVVCVGADGRESRDQIAVAVAREGIIALGRKFHPQENERGYVILAKDYRTLEEGKPRVFPLGDRQFFLCACYDSHAIAQGLVPKPHAGRFVVLTLVHLFLPKGEGLSGVRYYATYGFAGASRAWDCPVFGSAVFRRRKVRDWPSGVVWVSGSKSTRDWSYAENGIQPANELRLEVPEGEVVVRLFRLLDV